MIPVSADQSELSDRTGIRRDALQEVSRAQVEAVAQVSLHELQVPETASEPGADRQAVLSHPTWTHRQVSNSLRMRYNRLQRDCLTWKPAQVDRVVGLSRSGLWVGIGSGKTLPVNT